MKLILILLNLSPLECEQSRVTAKISSSQYPSRKYYEVFKNKSSIYQKFPNQLATYDMARERLIKVNLFFDDLEYTSMTETAAMTIVDLLSSVGGVLGLFL